jgi:hypothetical protein
MPHLENLESLLNPLSLERTMRSNCSVGPFLPFILFPMSFVLCLLIYFFLLFLVFFYLFVTQNQIILNRIFGSHTGGYEEFCLMEYNVM